LRRVITDIRTAERYIEGVVELRFFGGLSVEETAELLRISPETLLRDWKMAKAWLRRELSRQSTPPPHARRLSVLMCHDRGSPQIFRPTSVQLRAE
jgi:hypothetical protein